MFGGAAGYEVEVAGGGLGVVGVRANYAGGGAEGGVGGGRGEEGVSFERFGDGGFGDGDGWVGGDGVAVNENVVVGYSAAFGCDDVGVV